MITRPLYAVEHPPTAHLLRPCRMELWSASPVPSTQPALSARLALADSEARRREHDDDREHDSNSACKLYIDTTSIALNVNGDKSEVVTVEPGEHTLRVVCSGDNPWRTCYGISGLAAGRCAGAHVSAGSISMVACSVSSRSMIRLLR